MDWPGLLAWSTKYYDGTTASTLGPMAEERKQFLFNALEGSMGGKMEDQNVRLKNHLVKLATEGEDCLDHNLAVIDECADFPDCCDNFAKLGGFEAFSSLLATASAPRQAQGLSVLCLYLSNNPAVQEAACKAGFLQLFVSLTESADAEVAYKAVSSIGQLIRGSPQIERNFIGSQGIDFICGILTATTDQRTVTKCLLFLNHLLLSEPELTPRAPIIAALSALTVTDESAVDALAVLRSSL
jgi:hypothetical protein